MTNLTPTNLDTNEVHSRSLTAFYDTREAADRAIRDLESAGIPRQHISRIDGGTASTSATSTSAGQGGTGFWDSLKDLFMPEEDRYGYAEGLRRGGYMVSVRAEEASYNRVLEILDRDGAVDMDQREASWRSEGWTGYQAGGVATGAATSAATTAGYAATGAASRPVAQAAAASDARSLRAGEDVIPIYEEQLRVGKRDVSHGRVRLRSYMVETPVTEQVTLHSERVDVERHAVDRPVSATDAMFQDRAIELEETAEEAVVSKQARVVEEISLRKEAHDRTETITDKVRRTEVEIEDERRSHSLQTTREAGTVTPKIDPTRKI